MTMTLNGRSWYGEAYRSVFPKQMDQFVLEAQRQERPQQRGLMCHYVHAGYVKFLFSSRAGAAEFYYDQYPALRPINRYEDYTSAWCADDNLRYRVIPYTGQDLDIRDTNFPLSIASLEHMDKQADLKQWHPKEYRPRLPDWSFLDYGPEHDVKSEPAPIEKLAPMPATIEKKTVSTSASPDRRITLHINLPMDCTSITISYNDDQEKTAQKQSS